MADISIIILTYNSSNHISACLDSIFKFYGEEIKEKKLELIIVDNNSTDGTRGAVFDFFQEEKSSELKIKIKENLTFIQNRENTGFAKGANLGAEEAKGEILLFLNPDTKFVDKSLTKASFDLENKTAIVGGKMKSAEGVENSAGKFYSILNILFFALGIENIVGIRFAGDKKKYVDYVSGGFIFVEKKVFDELSGFDEKYFMYVEDMDLCFRAKKLGYKVLYNPEIALVHYKHGSSSRSFAIINIYKGIYYFFKKNRGQIEYFFVRLILSAKAIGVILLGFITRNREYVRTYKEALRV